MSDWLNGCLHTQNLIRLTEPKRKLILVHELAVLLGSLGPHLDCRVV